MLVAPCGIGYEMVLSCSGSKFKSASKCPQGALIKMAFHRGCIVHHAMQHTLFAERSVNNFNMVYLTSQVEANMLKGSNFKMSSNQIGTAKN